VLDGLSTLSHALTKIVADLCWVIELSIRQNVMSPVAFGEQRSVHRLQITGSLSWKALTASRNDRLRLTLWHNEVPKDMELKIYIRGVMGMFSQAWTALPRTAAR
jgi:hypothetical protein